MTQSTTPTEADFTNAPTAEEGFQRFERGAAFLYSPEFKVFAEKAGNGDNPAERRRLARLLDAHMEGTASPTT